MDANDVADTTAAGDTFCGYVAAGLSAGSTIADACRTANAAAALACTVPGAQPSFPTVVAVHEFLDRSGG